MKLLLDTHIWVWSVLETDRLSRRVSKELENPDNELWLSPISIWEVLILCQKKRMVLDQEPDVWVPRAMRALLLREAPITHEVALETARLQLPHRDPADYFLAATARVYDLTLVTADEHLLKAPGLSTLANR
ncbi:MAG: type II toxin-antitoxin system VapC family toxin [Acidobacteriia bacterium]|nr:type II toxin-antitoxin system VapC family toxin [Terriglobia bacterium]